MGRVGAIGAGLIALALVFSAGTQVAYAGTCASGLTCTIELTVSNVTELTPILINVIWDNSSGTETQFEVQWISGGPGTPGFIQDFGYNIAVDTDSVSYNGNDVTSLWTINGSGVLDGFGSFARTATNGPTAAGQREGISAPIIFTLTSLVTSIPDTTAGTEFVVHIGGYTSGCSGWVGERGSTPDTKSDTSCSSVSEPAVLLLTGVGLAGAGYLARRRSWFSRLAC